MNIQPKNEKIQPIKETVDKIQNQKINALITLLTGIAEDLIRAGKLYIQMLKGDSTIRETLLNHTSGIFNASMLSQLEQFGRQELHPKWILMSGSAAARIRRLPYSEQLKYVTFPISVLVERQNSSTGVVSTDRLNVMVENLTPPQVKQVFSKDHVRSDAEQKAFLASIPRTIRVAGPSFKKVGKNIIFVGGRGSWTKGEFRKIIESVGWNDMLVPK